MKKYKYQYIYIYQSIYIYIYVCIYIYTYRERGTLNGNKTGAANITEAKSSPASLATLGFRVVGQCYKHPRASGGLPELTTRKTFSNPKT